MESILYFGARDHGALWQVHDHLSRFAAPGSVYSSRAFVPYFQIVSGHARGTDIVSELTAHSLGWNVASYPAKWKTAAGKTNPGAGFDRNKVMVDVCARAFGFLWPGCKGSLHTETLLKKSKKPFEMIEPALQDTGCVFYTGVHRSSRQGNPYKGPGAVDISSRSFSTTWVRFAPSLPLLHRIQSEQSKALRMNNREESQAVLDAAWKSYAPEYRQEMATLYRREPDLFVNALRQNFFVLTCYCNSASGMGRDEHTARCHRGLLAGFFVKVAARHGLRVLDGGEVDPLRIDRSVRS